MEKKLPLIKKADFYVSIIMFLFSGLILFQVVTTSVEDSRLMPMLVFILSLTSSVAMLIQTIRNKNDIVSVGSLKISKKELIVAVILFACYYLITFLGFYASIFVMTTGISLVLWNCKTVKEYVILAVYNIVLIIMLFIMFNKFFAMVMPTGIFY